MALFFDKVQFKIISIKKYL